MVGVGLSPTPTILHARLFFCLLSITRIMDRLACFVRRINLFLYELYELEEKIGDFLFQFIQFIQKEIYKLRMSSPHCHHLNGRCMRTTHSSSRSYSRSGIEEFFNGFLIIL